jgi:serine/threonine protein kinase
MKPEVLLAPNQVLRGRVAEYRILNLIGRGGMGAVYRVQRTVDATIWALKEMRPPPDTPPDELEDNRRLFFQEVELLTKLSHPSMPVVADFFEHDLRPVLVMEFVPGQTLEDLMHDTNAPLLRQQAISYTIQVARVLGYLHKQKPPIIYRDMKPSNVMLTPEGVLKLLDFGVARTYKAKKSKDTVAMGSAGYAPPEQYGKQQTDARSDIYALGATLLHLLTNMPPIPLHTPTEGSINKLNPSVDKKTERVVIKAMQERQDLRYQTMAEFEKALHGCLTSAYVDPTITATPPPPVVPPAIPAQKPMPVEPTAPTIVPSQIPSSPPQVPTQLPPQNPVLAPTVVVAPANGPACSRCGRVNKPQARFCAGCGAPLGTALVARLLLSSPRGSWEQKLDRNLARIGRRDPRQNHYPEIDLAEYDRGVASRHHAEIRRDGDYYTLTDLGSTNGTQLNGVTVPARRPQRLRSGDRIRVGEVEMEFRWG